MPKEALTGEGESRSEGYGRLRSTHEQTNPIPKTPATLESLWFYGATQVRGLLTTFAASQSDGFGELST